VNWEKTGIVLLEWESIFTHGACIVDGYPSHLQGLWDWTNEQSNIRLFVFVLLLNDCM
jgi:hypothetical protein